MTTHGPAVPPRAETPHATEEGATSAAPTAVPLRPPGDHSIPGTPHHTLSGAGTREPASGDTFHGLIRRETSHWTDRLPPGAIPTFPTTPPHSLTHSDPIGHLHSRGHVHPDRMRRGNAPPIPFFSGEDPAVNVDDWLPSLERASTWNGWSMTEKVMQLPGYLKGRAVQEWSLLSPTAQQDYTAAIEAIRSRLDSTNRTMAAQEFRHSTQPQGESVADFIRRLEKAFQVAYGKDSLHSDTRDALLYSQLYDGLRYNLMRGPAVSGSQNYRELCVAARGEEHRLAALQQRHQLKPPTETSGRSKKPDAGQTNSRGSNQDTTSSLSRKQAPSSVMSETQVICYNCGMPGHMAKNCRQKKQESKGRTPNKTGQSQTKQVLSEDQGTSQSQQDASTPESLLYSDSDNEGAKACTVRVQDGGSISQCVKVQLQGVPAYGFIDAGADITIIGSKLFKKVATITRLKKRHFKKADKIPKTYYQKTFKLDERKDLDVTFEGRTMCAPVYIKMDAVDQLHVLLSEGVCRQLGMITFHPKVEQWTRSHQRAPLHLPAPRSH